MDRPGEPVPGLPRLCAPVGHRQEGLGGRDGRAQGCRRVRVAPQAPEGRAHPRGRVREDLGRHHRLDDPEVRSPLSFLAPPPLSLGSLQSLTRFSRPSPASPPSPPFGLTRHSPHPSPHAPPSSVPLRPPPSHRSQRQRPKHVRQQLRRAPHRHAPGVRHELAARPRRHAPVPLCASASPSSLLPAPFCSLLTLPAPLAPATAPRRQVGLPRDAQERALARVRRPGRRPVLHAPQPPLGPPPARPPRAGARAHVRRRRGLDLRESALSLVRMGRSERRSPARLSPSVRGPAADLVRSLARRTTSASSA